MNTVVLGLAQEGDTSIEERWCNLVADFLDKLWSELTYNGW